MKKAPDLEGLGDTVIVPRTISTIRIQLTKENLEHAVNDASTPPLFELPEGCSETRQRLRRGAVDYYARSGNLTGWKKLYCPDAFRDSGQCRAFKTKRLLVRDDSTIGAVEKLRRIHRSDLQHLVISLSDISLGHLEAPWNIFLDPSINVIKKRVKKGLITGPAVFRLEVGDNFKLHLHVICGPQSSLNRSWSRQVRSMSDLEKLILYVCKCPFPIPGRTRKKRPPQDQAEFNAALELMGLFLKYQGEARGRKARVKKAASKSPGSPKAKRSKNAPGLILPRRSFDQGIPRQRSGSKHGVTRPGLGSTFLERSDLPASGTNPFVFVKSKSEETIGQDSVFPKTRVWPVHSLTRLKSGSHALARASFGLGHEGHHPPW
jgi:hypothetical protein